MNPPPLYLCATILSVLVPLKTITMHLPLSKKTVPFVNRISRLKFGLVLVAVHDTVAVFTVPSLISMSGRERVPEDGSSTDTLTGELKKPMSPFASSLDMFTIFNLD